MSTLLVRDVMTKDVITVPPEFGYKQLVDLLVEAAVSAVPVVDAERQVLGVVSEADLLHKVEFNGADVEVRLFERRRAREAKEKANGDTAGSLMSSPPITIGEGATLAEAARTMERRNVKRLPVVDDDGALVGIVARRDVLRRYLRDDAAVRRDIVENVLRHTMWIDPVEIEILVVDGRVSLAGEMDRRSTVQIADRLIRAVDGVVSVDNRLEWRFDDTTVQHRYTFDA